MTRGFTMASASLAFLENHDFAEICDLSVDDSSGSDQPKQRRIRKSTQKPGWEGVAGSGKQASTMPRKKKEDRPQSPDPAMLNLQAEPPADDAYEAFESEIPAYLLAKVDGDELLHLLDSDAGTPFDTPRDDEDDDQGQEDEFANAMQRKNVPKPIAVVPEPISRVGPGPVDVEDVDASVLGHFKESTEVLRGETEQDELLKGDWQNVGDKDWSVAHAKLLYMISCHAKASSSFHSVDTWIRYPHTIVLINELVKSSVLAYQPVPASLPITNHGTSTRVWVNMSHGAVCALNELCEAGLVNVLRMVTEDFCQAPAYQSSLVGEKMVSRMPPELKEQVETAIHGPYGYEFEMLTVVFEDRDFMLTTNSGFVKRSDITNIGAVPYITSPYIPPCLRHSDKHLTDSSSRNYECALWDSDVSDVRGEAISLANVTVVLAEWVPMGANNIFALTERLGQNTFPYTHRHLPSGKASVPIFFKGSAKNSGTEQVGDGDAPDAVRTSSTLVDSEGSSSVNFEGMRVARDGGDLPGVRRVEHYGVHFGVERGVVVGLQMESVMERDWDDMCFEMVARASCDFQQHSTSYIDDLLSHEQHRLIEFLFAGEQSSRNKVQCLVIDQIEPKMEASAYLDYDMYEAELSRAIGDVQIARDLGDKTDLLFIGQNGIIVAGPNTRKADKVYTDWLTLTGKDYFIRNLFVRLSTTASKIEDLNEHILTAWTDPSGIDKARTKLRILTGDLALIGQMLHLCLASLENQTPVMRPKDQVGKDMFEALRLNRLQDEVKRSVNDLQKLYDSTQQLLETMNERFNVEQRKLLKGVYSEVSNMADQMFRRQSGLAITHKGTVTLPSELPIRVLVVCLGGMLGIEMLNRLHSGKEVGDITPAWFASGLEPVSESSPATLFILQLCFIFLFSYTGIWYLNRSSKRSSESLHKRAKIGRKIIDKKALVRFLEDSGCIAASTIASRTGFEDSKRTNVSFTDTNFFRWFGDYPLVTLEIDFDNMYVISALLSWDYMGKRISKCEPYGLVCDMLVDCGAISQEDPRNPVPSWLKDKQ